MTVKSVSSNFQQNIEENPRKRRYSDKINQAYRKSISNQTEKRSKTKHVKSRIIARIDPVDEIHVHDAFELGMQSRAMFIQNLIHELKGDEIEELGLVGLLDEEDLNDAEEVSISNRDFKLLDDLSKEYSPIVASQIYEIYAICLKQPRKYSEACKALKNLATQLIRELPRQEEEGMEICEVEDKYTKAAEKGAHLLPFELTEEQIKQFAYVMQEASKHALEQKEDIEIEPEDQESEIVDTLGNIILVAQQDFPSVCDCLEFEHRKDILKHFRMKAQKILKTYRTRIDDHSWKHEKTGLFDHELAQLHRINIEIAKLILLDTGGINFGIVNDAYQELFPNQLKKTQIGKDYYYLLENLRDDPTLGMIIQSVNPPKDPKLSSNDLIRVTLGLSPNQTITKRDAQLTVLSGIIPLRQAKAGTCFATCFLIKMMFSHLRLCLQDFADLVENGEMKRIVINEARNFPFHLCTSKDGLNTILEVNRDGKITNHQFYEQNQDENTSRQIYRGYLYENPGIVDACRILAIIDVKKAVLTTVQRITSDQYNIDQFLKELSKYAYEQREKARYYLRSTPMDTLEELTTKAQFAFSSQVNTPIQRIWEQVGSSLVFYFNSQYCFPAFTHQAFETVLEKPSVHMSKTHKRMWKMLIKESFLPMITRLRYLYKHHIDDEKLIFEDGNFGVRDYYDFGYVLASTELPGDFEFSHDLYNAYKNENDTINLERFNDYPPANTWKELDTGEKFQEFIKEVIWQTVDYLIDKDKKKKNDWIHVGEKMCEKVEMATFRKKMIESILGRSSEQAKDYRKNEHSISTTPWIFRWGGLFSEVQKSFFNFSEYPVKTLKHSGSQKDILNWILTYHRKQPENIREQFSDPYFMLEVNAPVHAFLFKPGHPSMQEALNSQLPPIQYIEEKIEKPGLDVANTLVTKKIRQELIDFVTMNRWYRRCDEKQDMERQELTERSKEIFDHLIRKATPHLDFETVYQITIQSRAQDPKIGKNHRFWEERFRRILIRKNHQISNIHELVDFARNRRDSIALSKEGYIKLKERMEQLGEKVSIHEFVKTLTDTMKKIHEEEIFAKDKDWESKFTPHLDCKLYKLLSPRLQKKLRGACLITHDTNWRKGVHNLHFLWIINPRTKKLEMHSINPDTNEIHFLFQKCWFPYKDSWEMPDNFRTYSHEPIFNLKKYMDL